MIGDSRENCIEWMNGDKRITCTFNQKKFINKVKKLAEVHENEVDFAQNEDGSIIAHLPLKALKLSIRIPTNWQFENKEELYEEEESEDVD